MLRLNTTTEKVTKLPAPEDWPDPMEIDIVDVTYFGDPSELAHCLDCLAEYCRLYDGYDDESGLLQAEAMARLVNELHWYSIFTDVGEKAKAFIDKTIERFSMH